MEASPTDYSERRASTFLVELISSASDDDPLLCKIVRAHLDDVNELGVLSVIHIPRSALVHSETVIEVVAGTVIYVNDGIH
jgi:hypothetical protein